MRENDAPTPRTTGRDTRWHFTLRDSALVAAIPALYIGAYALRFWHLLP